MIGSFKNSLEVMDILVDEMILVKVVYHNTNSINYAETRVNTSGVNEKNSRESYDELLIFVYMKKCLIKIQLTCQY